MCLCRQTFNPIHKIFNTLHSISDINSFYKFKNIWRTFARVRACTDGRTDRQTKFILYDYTNVQFIPCSHYDYTSQNTAFKMTDYLTPMTSCWKKHVLMSYCHFFNHSLYGCLLSSYCSATKFSDIAYLSNNSLKILCKSGMHVADSVAVTRNHSLKEFI